MRRISSFYGIIIWMYWNDHNPPHFHATYGNFKILIRIADLSIYSGSLPSRAFGLVMEWASVHQTELMENWNNLGQNKVPNRIDPLKLLELSLIPIKQSSIIVQKDERNATQR